MRSSRFWRSVRGLYPGMGNFNGRRGYRRQRRELSPQPLFRKARKPLSRQAHLLRALLLPEIGEVSSPRSAAKHHISLISLSALMEERRNIPTLIAQESSSASEHRNPMPSILKSSLKARPTRGVAAPTALSRSRERVIISRCYGLAISTPIRSSLTASLRRSSLQSHALTSGV